jgi:site-specific DNA-methyltransferase (adenine-specific)
MEYNIWRVMTEQQKFKHPAVFPEKIAADHIKSWSNEEDVVLDPFMGSGTTAKMARALRRHYIGFEISPEYIAIAQKRLDDNRSMFDLDYNS